MEETAWPGRRSHEIVQRGEKCGVARGNAGSGYYSQNIWYLAGIFWITTMCKACDKY